MRLTNTGVPSSHWAPVGVLQITGLSWWLSGQESTCSARGSGFDLCAGEDPLGKGMAAHSSILAWRVPWTEEPTVHGVAEESDATERLALTHLLCGMLGMHTVEEARLR